MFGLSLKSMAITGGVGFVAGIVMATAGTATFYEKAIVPGREAAVEERVTRDVEERIATASRAAAALAIAGEMQRRAAAIDAALTRYQNEHARAEAEEAAKLQALEEENLRYARILAASGRSCPLVDDDLPFLNGLQNAPK